MGLAALVWLTVTSATVNVVHGAGGWVIGLPLATFLAFRVWQWRIRRFP